MSGRAGAAASSIPKCPACGKGRHSREDCWVLHPSKAPESLQDKLKFEKIGEGSPLRKEVGKEKDHTKVGSFCLARAAGARCIHRRIVGRPIRSCGRKPRPRGGSVSNTTEKLPGNAVDPRRLTRLLGIWAPHRRLYAPLCG